jgi:hypothetical protein
VHSACTVGSDDTVVSLSLEGRGLVCLEIVGQVLHMSIMVIFYSFTAKHTLALTPAAIKLPFHLSTICAHMSIRIHV